jgi:hypothetical protein
MRTTESKRRAGRIAKAAYDDSEANRLHSLKNTPEYKKWIDDWRDGHATMNTKNFRAIDRDKGQFSQ